MGVSVLGLADQNVMTEQVINTRWSDCNFAGVDLSGLAINYAQCLGQRWHHNAHFFLESAETMLEKIIATYPGPLQLCLIQFPTPYRLPTLSLEKSEERGNLQLPATCEDGFMVSEKLLHLVHDALAPKGKLLIQSNCEDVAVWIRNTAITSCNFDIVDTIPSLLSCDDDSRPTTPTKRSYDWIAAGGERAQGSGWSSWPLLPRRGRTETEVACMLNGTPVHRCLLVKMPSSQGHC
jgi:tRNA G46 methylase TrmB